MGRWEFVCRDRRLCCEEFVGIGGIGWWGNISEEDVGSWKVMEKERFQTEKIFFGLRAILSGGRSRGEKNVRTQEIVGWRRREAKIK